MRKLAAFAAVSALAAAALATPAAAATLTHAYEFGNAGGTQALDLIGTQNGTLTGDAVIAGGVLTLDGAGDSVTFGTQLIDFSSPFSVFIRAQLLDPVNRYSEIIAQGSSGGPGFYIGSSFNQYRLSDAYLSPGLTFHVDNAFHNLLLTNGGGSLKYSIDGTEVFSGAQASFGGACNTVIGDQFCGVYGEYFKGSIDTVRIYRGVATYAEASANGAVVPEPAAWALMIVGFGAVGAGVRRRRAALA